METDAQMLHCDVLVIGGGIAGLLAALEARRRAERVVLVSKRKPGRSGNSAVTIAGFSAPVREEVSGGPAEHLRDTMEVGGGINDPGLVRTLASEAAERVMALEQFGIRFQRDDGLVGLRGSPGHSRPRLVNPEAPGVPHNTLGLSLTLPLLKAARERGVALLSDMPVHRLLLADGEVCGADALDLQAGARVTILAGAVVLAAGGAGQLYGRTSNALDATGDSYALGLVAGAALRDMEFVQFYPAVMTWPAHATISNSLFSDGVVLRNRHGERFMHRYDPANGDRAVRDVMSRAVFQEIQAGNGVDGGVYLDCTAIPPALLERRFPDMVERGICVSLGADSANGSDHLSMLKIMHAVACLYKDVRLDESVMPAETVLEMATVRGAEALLLEDRIGSIEPGKRADLVLFDRNHPEWRPLLNIPNTLVYSVPDRTVSTVIVGGEVVLDGGRISNVDEEEVYRKADRLALRLLDKASLAAPSRWPVV